jgi:hypothetical protein
MNSRSSPALTTLALAGWIWGKCRLFPVTRKSAFPAIAQAMNLSSSRIGRSKGNWDRIKEVAMAAEQIEQVIDLALRKPKPWAKKNVGVLLQDLAGKTWRNQPLVDGHDEQGFISRR